MTVPVVGQRHFDTAVFCDVLDGVFGEAFVVFFGIGGGVVFTTAVGFFGVLAVVGFALDELVDLRFCAGGFCAR